MWIKLILYTMYAFAFIRPYAGYNLEVHKVGIAKGEPGSQFGYTVVLVDDRDPNLKVLPNKLLLAGSPNLTVDGIRAHGDVYKCNGSQTENLRCVPMGIQDTSGMCDKLKEGQKGRSHCKEDSRMGATMALNRKYFTRTKKGDRTFPEVPMVTMCAPGWKNVLYEVAKQFEKYMFGMCLKVDHRLQTKNCSIKHYREYCWPFWGGNVEGQKATDREGRAVFAYAVGGFSAAFTNDGSSEIIGAPGVNRNRGAFKAYNKEWFLTKTFEHQQSTIYFGYAMASGKFKNGANLLIGSPNFHTTEYGYRGKVYMQRGTEKKLGIEFTSGLPSLSLQPEGTSKLDLTWTVWWVGFWVDLSQGYEVGKMKELTRLYNGFNSCEFSDGTDDDIKDFMKDVKEYMYFGTKFGAAVAAIDIDGDGYDEVFIGAPLFSDNRVEEGKVFVYRSENDSVCVLGILSGAAHIPELEGEISYGRFGTSISTAGDLDADGYNDVAIGAPYEDGGRGVVYIYNGLRRKYSPMYDEFSQRITGRELDTGLRGFGFSIFGGGDDVDHNGFPDLAVGAYVSDQAVILRSRPVAIVAVDLDLRPRPIPLLAVDLACSNGTNLCFNLNMTFAYKIDDGMGKDNGPITVRYYLDADTIYKKKENGKSRVVFRYNQGSELNNKISIQRGNSIPVNYTIDVLPDDLGKPDPRDPWTTIQISGYYELVPTEREDFNKLDHILSSACSHNFSVEADFDKKCDTITECTSDLDLYVELHLLGRSQSEKVNSSTVIFVDDKNQMEMIMEVINTLNVSYRTNISAEVSAVLRRSVFQDGAIPAECKYDLYRLPCRMNCTAQEELDKNEDIRVKTNFDISRARLVPEPRTLKNMQRFVNISVVTNQGNTDEDPSNNIFIISIPVMIKSEIDMVADTENFNNVRFKADPKSTRRIQIKHTYYVTNNGPSFLPKTFVNISIPYKRGGEKFASVQSGSTLCVQRGKQSQVTTELPVTTTMIDYDIADPDSAKRKRREAVTAMTSSTDETKKTTVATLTDRNITCEEGYECVVIECELLEMDRAETKTFDMSITVDEKEIAREKGVHRVKFVTKASATPPSVWFPEKVVPWDNPVEEYRTTNFIVEPDSVVTEVNIWIIIGSVLGALALLIIIMIILWKTGFFQRKKQQQLKRMRQESLYKRRSQMRPTSTMTTTGASPPYNQIEADDEKS